LTFYTYTRALERALQALAAEAITVRLVKVLKRWFARRPSAAEKQLLHRCFGDAVELDRLIAYELGRRPQLSRSQAAQAALERWTRDR
jgi:hypothetical protein